MNWYLVVLIVNTSPLPGNIAYPSPNANILLPAYTSELACQEGGTKRLETMVKDAGKKYVFACVQIP